MNGHLSKEEFYLDNEQVTLLVQCLRATVQRFQYDAVIFSFMATEFKRKAEQTQHMADRIELATFVLVGKEFNGE